MSALQSDDLLAKIRNDRVVMNALATLCDFEVVPLDQRRERPEWFSLDGATHCETIATAANGDYFLLVGPMSRLLYVTVDAQAGVIARNLTEGICLMTDAPHWHDLLKFSNRGELAEMKRAVPYCERSVRQLEPNVDRLRQTIRSRLSLSCDGDPIELLHSAVHDLSVEFDVLNKDGTRMGSLFNRFSADDLSRAIQ